MISAANSQAYGPPNGGSPWGTGPTWCDNAWPHGYWRAPWAPHNLPRPLAIALMVVGFILWWPVGLAILFYMIGSGRMGCRGFRRQGNAASPWQSGAPWASWRSWGGGPPATPSSGNHAFDEYRTETLRRLEEEQQELRSHAEGPGNGSASGLG